MGGPLDAGLVVSAADQAMLGRGRVKRSETGCRTGRRQGVAQLIAKVRF
jgi:hypothetical protein